MSEIGTFSYSLITGNYCLTQGVVTLDVDCGDVVHTVGEFLSE